ncbi:MAG: aldo/keto reductase [candidate division WOR-3 bacterium]
MLPKIKLGKTKEEIPIFSLGTWAIRNEREMIKVIQYSIDTGLNHIDTAEMYTGAEEIVGKAIKGYDRKKIFITSKVLPSNAYFKGVIKSCDNSLLKLKTDYIDLYLLHYYTGEYPLKETFDAFNYLIEKGKVRYVGVSNFEVKEYEKFKTFLKEYNIQNNQIEYNLSNWQYVEEKILPLYENEDITLSGYSPLWQNNPPKGTKGFKVLEEIGKKYGKLPFQVALNFLTRHRKIFIIFKTENIEHLKENIESLNFNLEEEDIKKIKENF